MKKIAFFMCGLCAVMFMSCTKTTGTENGHEWVDLGLPSGTKWATCNVGASKPEEYGNYYAWGETTPKDYYNWSTYKWCKGSATTLTKYNTRSSYGTVDNKTVLELADDAARANWGGAWRMPTDAEWTELRENCTWTWTTKNGVNGYEVKSEANGNSIFLPAAGYRGHDDLGNAGDHGYYWSSSLNTDLPYYAWYVTSTRTTWAGTTATAIAVDPSALFFKGNFTSFSWAGRANAAGKRGGAAGRAVPPLRCRP